MKLLGNIIWVVFGGLAISIEYLIGAVGLIITIIGIPFGLQVFKLGILALWPFGSRVRKIEPQHGCLNLFMNVLWFFIILFCITIIGIPFGRMHFRLAGLALSPFGKEVV